MKRKTNNSVIIILRGASIFLENSSGILIISWIILFELVFEKYDCNACHTIGKGRLIGPDLKGITERREKVWLENWIRDSKKLIDSGDPIAISVYNDYGKSPMLPYNLTDIEMARLLEYLAEK